MNRLRPNTVPVRRGNRSAFTLIELVIVVMIVSIFAAAAAPRYLDALANFRDDTTIRRIVADLEMAKRRARQTSSPQSIVFYVADNRYEITGMQDLDRSNKIYEFRFGGKTSQAKLISADFGGSTTLVFDIYGQPSKAGTIVFNAGRGDLTIKLEASGRIDAPTRADVAAL